MTVGGIPTPGRSVTTNLSGGYTFSDGTTSNTQLSGGNGQVALPTINVPNTGGTATIASLSDSSSATASAVAPIVKNAGLSDNSPNYSTMSYPKGTTCPAPMTYLTPDRDLYLYNSLVTSNVTSVRSHGEANVGWFVTFMRSDGTGGHRLSNGTTIDVTFPSGTTACGNYLFLTPLGELYRGQSARIDVQVFSAASQMQQGVGYWTNWITAAGSASLTEINGVVSTHSFPARTICPSPMTFLTPDRELYLYFDHVASDVTSVVSHGETNVGWFVTFMRSDGTGGHRLSNGSIVDVTFPAGTIACGSYLFLTPSGDLYQGQSQKITSKVKSAAGEMQNGVAYWSNWVTENC
ncbi:hypothetical protein [Microbacterium sp. SLBN-111]|uniref:hypothetical protein n=1 Tax=Microbacterium sp. SLBN-111 TaxID=3377733 RepID=UPI003C79358E